MNRFCSCAYILLEGVPALLSYIIRKTKCSGVSEQNVPFLKTKRTSVNLFITPINPIKKHQKNRLLWCFLLSYYLAILPKITNFTTNKGIVVSCYNAIARLL